MMILSLDCAGSGCAACVMNDMHVLALEQEQMARGQDARLMPLVQDVMARAGCTYAQLDRIAVTRGPGSFTGLRIGLAAARGLGLAARKPVLGIDRFVVHYEQHKHIGHDLLVVLESRRLELYVQSFSALGARGEAALIPVEEIIELAQGHPSLRIAGDARSHLQDKLEAVFFLDATESEAQTCAKLALMADENDPNMLPRPLYLRAPDVTIKAQGGCCA